MIKVRETSLPGVLVLVPAIFPDDRGVFWESFNLRDVTEAGLPATWVQDNFSLSSKNVLRGIHYQIARPQGKLIRVTHGKILDVAVDLRRSSPTFAKHITIELTGTSSEMLWIPEGFGHGFLALTDQVGTAYKVTDYYNPHCERTIAWNDPDLSIPWPVDPAEVIISAKDRSGSLLKDAEIFP